MDFSLDAIMGSVGGTSGILTEARGFFDSYIQKGIATRQLKNEKELALYSRGLDYQTASDTLDAQIRLKEIEESTNVVGITSGSGTTKYVVTALAIAGVLGIGIFSYSYMKK